MKKKLIRITTVPMALKFLLPGQMKFMKENGFDVTMVSADGPERNDVITEEGCEHIIVPMTRKITPLQDFKCLLQLIKIFKNEKPNIVHTHTPKAGLLGMLAAKYCGVKIRIHTVAGLPLMVEKGFKYWLLKSIEKITYSAANQVWPNSDSLLTFIRNQRLTSDKKLSIILKGSSNGIDLTRFSLSNINQTILKQIKTDINYNINNTYFICVSRIVKDKGVSELVEAFKSIVSKNDKIKLLLVGKFEEDLDPLNLDIKNEIVNNKNIIHVDWTKHVEYYMSLSNFFVFPSHREGFPNVLLQSGALGIPIICSSIVGNIDIINDGETGLLFEPKSVVSLTNKIEFALSNHSLLNQMAQNLQLDIYKNYEREKIWIAILNNYTTLLNKPD
jgi:glycosyltransferase involved in cell wall biosynthesis